MLSLVRSWPRLAHAYLRGAGIRARTCSDGAAAVDAQGCRPLPAEQAALLYAGHPALPSRAVRRRRSRREARERRESVHLRLRTPVALLLQGRRANTFRLARARRGRKAAALAAARVEAAACAGSAVGGHCQGQGQGRRGWRLLLAAVAPPQDRHPWAALARVLAAHGPQRLPRGAHMAECRRRQPRRPSRQDAGAYALPCASCASPPLPLPSSPPLPVVPALARSPPNARARLGRPVSRWTATARASPGASPCGSALPCRRPSPTR